MRLIGERELDLMGIKKIGHRMKILDTLRKSQWNGNELHNLMNME